LRIESYITARLENTSINVYTDATKAVITNINQFLGVLIQSYKDLNKIRTSELQLIELKQNALVSKYLTRFTQYLFRVY
jgi:chemotaxis signal transduction protein